MRIRAASDSSDPTSYDFGYDNSRCSHAFAKAHVRSAVRGEMSIACRSERSSGRQIAELHQFSRRSIMLNQSIQGGIQRNQVFAWFCGLDVDEIDFFAFPFAAMFEPAFPAPAFRRPKSSAWLQRQQQRNARESSQCWILSVSTSRTNAEWTRAVA